MAEENAVIREFRDRDAAEVAACIAALQDYERAIEPRLRSGASMASDYLKQSLDRCRAYAGRIFVVESGGGICGFVTVLGRLPFQELDEPPGEFAIVTDLMVLEPLRRHGYGRRLLEAAEQHAREVGAVELRIGVLSGNESARRLYRQMGFDGYSEMLAKRINRDAEAATRRRDA